MTNLWNGPTLYDDRWMQNIKDGSQLAVLGVILASTHGLQTLAINRYAGFYLTDDSELIKPHYFTLSGIFGSLLHSSEVTTSHIPGLADLRSLSCVGLVPCDLIQLPHLRALQFGLQNRQWRDAPQAIRLPSPAVTDKLSTPATHLKVTVDVGCLVAASDGIREHLKELTGRLDGLRHLTFDLQPLLRCQYEWPYDVLFGDFQTLATKIPTSEIETRVIDTQDLRNAELGFNEHGLESRKPQRWVECLRPARSVDYLANLRKIVASPELFFSLDEHFLICDLPYCLQEINIFDTTFALHRHKTS
ncbi:hypothetical protein BKA63DRAFT_100920 [Paraphoma chrysanthemicola]|nr:hypothetical protein BKA63DRAFT_100920 [Paraphoma chrysanthemicola]